MTTPKGDGGKDSPESKVLSPESGHQTCDDGGPAIPVSWGQHNGLSIRDAFAMAALRGLPSTAGLYNSDEEAAVAKSRAAYKIADAMLKQRSKPCS
jgi:hypothetical protein